MKKYLAIIIVFSMVIFGSALYLHNSKNNPDNKDSLVAGINVEVTNTPVMQTLTLAITTSDNSTATYPVTFEAGTKMIDILYKFSQNNADFNFSTKKSDWGEMITEMNGISAETKEFWNIKVNGNDSNVGVSDLTPQPGDLINFILLKF